MLPMILLHKMLHKKLFRTQITGEGMQLVSHLVQHILCNSIFYQACAVFNVLYLDIE